MNIINAILNEPEFIRSAKSELAVVSKELRRLISIYGQDDLKVISIRNRHTELCGIILEFTDYQSRIVKSLSETSRDIKKIIDDNHVDPVTSVLIANALQ